MDLKNHFAMYIVYALCNNITVKRKVIAQSRGLKKNSCILERNKLHFII